ncbi:hypothetical protein G7069_04300 [Lysobacter sp. HDW10]|uniref:hypothetical protein n=1 Tax=Lysobacter sp. HDW10 TaxID=2714936 RepID=UPI00140E1B38|nr:hypothetical protein [Lysobacter sp. HDW10]QIK80889.1 hypothetical protein G7069_04300 [Lysobacter sp. HDW10]
MRIEIDEIVDLVQRTPGIYRRPDRIDVAREIANLRAKLQSTIDANLQPWFVLIDESIQFFFLLERFMFRQPLHDNEVPFAIQCSKIKRDLVSIRELIAIGQDICAAVLVRTFLEDLEISMVVALDKEKSASYITTDNQADFWNKHVGYGRVYGHISQYLSTSGAQESEIRETIERHKQMKRFCSDCTHGGMISSLRSAFTPSLTDIDELHHQSLGSISPDARYICLSVSEECRVFAGSLVNHLARGSKLHVYERFSLDDKLFDVFSSAYVLQELIKRYGRKLLDASGA